MEKKCVVVLYGGRSVEHGVSINSARNILQYIDRDRFRPVAVGISPDGRWFLTPDVTRDMTTGEELTINTNPSAPELRSGRETIRPDVVFPVLHGTDGEDGSIQGLLKSFDIPFVGSGVLGSALSMNKIIAKQLLAAAGLPVTPFRYFHYSQRGQIGYESIAAELGTPFMVKSASLGSSVGVSKVRNKEEFDAALADSFSYDEEVLFEQYIKGREIECAVLGNDPPQASRPGEIVISDKYEFYSFDAKYVDGEAVEIRIPADLTPDEEKQVREISVQAFQALRCRDFARVDLFLSDQRMFINEINTIPGFTNSSMYPMMWKERGIGFTDLISKLIDTAFDRTLRENRIRRDFQSDLKY